MCLHADAVLLYCQALVLLPQDPCLLSNRSAALLQAGRAVEAAEDARACVQVRGEAVCLL